MSADRGDHAAAGEPTLRRCGAETYDAIIDPTDPVVRRTVLAALPEDPPEWLVQTVLLGGRIAPWEAWRRLREEAFPLEKAENDCCDSTWHQGDHLKYAGCPHCGQPGQNDGSAPHVQP